MDSTSIGMTVALVILVAMSAYFSATETAFTSLNRIRLKSRADNGDQRAARALALAEDYDKLLSTILIGNNIVNNVATTIGAVLFIRLLDDVRGPTVSAIVLTVVILIFGEVSPKSLAKESQAENEGGPDEHESELIRNAIEFHDLEVSEILTPRVDIVAAEENSTMEEVGSLFAESGYSRLPIYQDSIDNIVGVIHEKDFYAARYRGETMISALKAPVLYTTGNTKISELMRILQRNKAHMAVVVDEYGGTEGIATLEDIVEELVGDIWDEHDEVIEEFKKQEDGSYLIACSADLDDMFDLFAVKGACAATTVSGWVMEQVGRVPEEGDHFQAEGLDVIVTRVEHRRVIEIQVRVLPEEEPETK